MVSLSPRLRHDVVLRVCAASLALFSIACSEGVGIGEVNGLVWAPACGLEATVLDLDPTFFAADPFDGSLEITVQRGSDFEDLTDGISIYVPSTEAVAMELRTPIPLSASGLDGVRMNLFLHRTCRFSRDEPPVSYVAIDGTIVFDAIYAPSLDENSLRTTATFSDVTLVDPAHPETRRAELSGEFTFLFNRGRPAQRFP